MTENQDYQYTEEFEEVSNETVIVQEGTIVNPLSLGNALQIAVSRQIYKITGTERAKPTTRLMDRADHFKVFRGAKKMKLVLGLKPSALLLLTYIEYTIERNVDYIKLSDREVCAETNMSRNSFFQAIKELGSKNIIAVRMDMKMTYWINPNFFFFGDRVKVYPRNITKEYDFPIYVNMF